MVKFDIECMCVVCHNPIPMPWGGRLQERSAIVCSSNCHCYMRYGRVKGDRDVGWKYRQNRMLQERRREAKVAQWRVAEFLKSQGVLLMETDDLERDEDDQYGERWLMSRAGAIKPKQTRRTLQRVAAR